MAACVLLAANFVDRPARPRQRLATRPLRRLALSCHAHILIGRKLITNCRLYQDRTEAGRAARRTPEMNLYMLLLVLAAELGLIAAQGSSGFIARVEGSSCATVHSRIQESAATIMTPIGKEQPDVPVERLDMMIASAEGRALGASNNECFVLLPGDDALAGEVRSLPGVVYVEQNLPVTANHHQYEIASWGLDRIDQGDRQLPLNEAYDPAYTGKGVSVYVFDTGVDVNNGEFEGRASHGPSFARASSDVGEHGSHVAGTVASKTFGVAKEATIVDVKVLTAKGDGSWWNVMHGIKWAIDNAPVPSVFTLLLGSKERGISQAVNDAVDAAFAKGHIVTVAAGNSNDDACFYSPSGAGGCGRVITVWPLTKLTRAPRSLATDRAVISLRLASVFSRSEARWMARRWLPPT